MPDPERRKVMRLPRGVLAICATLLLSSILYFILLAQCSGLYDQTTLMRMIPIVLAVLAVAWIPVGRRLIDFRILIASVAVILILQSMAIWSGIGTILPYASESEIPIIAKASMLVAIGSAASFWVAYRGQKRTAIAIFILLAASVFVVNNRLLKMRPVDIDVWYFHHDAVAALARGQNPYAITFRNIYANEGKDDAWVYSPEVQKNGRLLFGYPYPPMSLLLTAPSELLVGDSRYVLTAYYLIAAALVAMMSRGGIGLCAGATLLLAPSVWQVYYKAWSEPQLILGLVVVAWCGLRQSKWLPVALGLFFSMKQYSIVLLPLLLLILPRPFSVRSSLRFLGTIALTGAIVSLPVALWDWRAYWHSTVHIQVIQPFRYDAVSFLAWYARSLPPGHPPPSSAWAFVVLIPTHALLLWKLPRNIAGFTLGVGVTMVMFLFFNRQSFMNYHTFAGAALLIAAATYERVYARMEDAHLEPVKEQSGQLSAAAIQ